MRPRKRAVGLVVGAAILFSIGTNVQAGWLFVLAALFLGAVLAGIVLPFTSVRGLRAQLVAPQEVAQGDEVTVEVRVDHPGRGVRWSVVLADDHLDHAEVFVPAVRPRERVEVSTTRIAARRGERRTSTIEVRSSAPFGVTERRRRLKVDATTLVLPRVLPLGELPFVEATGTYEAGMHRWPRRGQGPEYLGIREYRSGDSMRHVHWGLTARHGQVMVREFEEEQTRRLAIVVDTERDRGTTWTPLDRCCAAAASVLSAAHAQGHGARLAAAVDPTRVDVLSRADQGDQLRWLARLVPTGMGLETALDRLGPVELRGVESVVVALPAWVGDPAGLAVALTKLPVRHVIPLVIGLRPDEGDRAQTRRCVEILQLAGLDVRPWAPAEDLATILSRKAVPG